MNAAEWDHKDLWRKFGKDFMVEISRHSEGSTEDRDPWGEGPHRWCVYAYIYPKHPHFAAFSGLDMWQEGATMMPLHGGPSFLAEPMRDGKVTSVQVGADYHHLYDDQYTQCDTPEKAWSVFEDAQQLFDWLAVRAIQRATTEAGKQP